MSFETFQQIPSHNIQAPEFHPMPVQPPPVYDTGEMIKPLLHLAEYMSPEARAKRKAAVAKANWEYRAYASGHPKEMLDPQWWTKNQILRNRLIIQKQEMDRNEQNLRLRNPENSEPDHIKSGMGIFGHKNVVATDVNENNVPPGGSHSGVTEEEELNDENPPGAPN